MFCKCLQLVAKCGKKKSRKAEELKHKLASRRASRGRKKKTERIQCMTLGYVLALCGVARASRGCRFRAPPTELCWSQPSRASKALALRLPTEQGVIFVFLCNLASATIAPTSPSQRTRAPAIVHPLSPIRPLLPIDNPPFSRAVPRALDSRLDSTKADTLRQHDGQLRRSDPPLAEAGRQASMVAITR